MTEQHPITPPSDLFRQWEDDILDKHDNVDHVLDCAWRHGFRTGADWQLEQVVQAWEQCMEDPGTDIQVIRRFGQKLKAMRPTTTQENN